MIVKKYVYKYETFQKKGFWNYLIYNSKSLEKKLLIESSEGFYSQSRAEFAALGHISLLENEGKST